MRFLCDEMLHGLGRWLRAAGYDTVIASGGVPDGILAARCLQEGRVLLTNDRHLAANAAASRAPVALVGGNGIDESALALGEKLEINWLFAPFTRCIVDNTVLEPAPPHLAAQVPVGSPDAGGLLRLCPACHRLYWPGSHVRRMQRRLAIWQTSRASSHKP